MWLQSQRVAKLVEIQEQLDTEAFPEGSCFLHTTTAGTNAFAVKRITGSAGASSGSSAAIEGISASRRSMVALAAGNADHKRHRFAIREIIFHVESAPL